MSLQEVQAKVTKGDRAGELFTAKLDLPDTLAEAQQRWGEDVVFSRLMSSLILDVQTTMRAAINKDGATLDSVQAAAAAWKPQVRKKAGMSKVDRIQSLLTKLTPDEKAKVLAGLA